MGQLLDSTAADLILDVARRNPGEVTLLLIGPATNAALAFHQDPEGFRKLKDIVAMSGAILEHGNTTAVAEFNAYADPEALDFIIGSGVPITLVPLDVTRQVALTRDKLEEQLRGRTDTRAEFLRCITEQGFSFYRGHLDWEGMYLHDPLAAAVALNRRLVDIRRMRVGVETRGEWTRGMTVAERRPWMKGGENVDVCLSVQSEAFLDDFCRRVFA
jgi:inosine-uridine nucleoside N-ribohydrolase